MKRNLIAIFMLIIWLVAFQTASAQFPVKIPKLPKPAKTETKPTPPPTNSTSSITNEDSSSQKISTSTTESEQRTADIFTKPEPTNKAMFLKDTLEIKLINKNKYWKFPNQNDYSSWLPSVDFVVFYDGSSKLRYTAEWTNADGSAWFSEALDARDGSRLTFIKSPYSSENFDTKATNGVGTYGLKLTNSKTGEILFQGKFKVAKLPLFPGDAKLKNRMQFFTEHDWNLPIGYVGIGEEDWSSVQLNPVVLMWFKGNLDSKDFEARLFHGNQLVTSTDDGGYIKTMQKRGDDNCYQFVETCKYSLWHFSWKNFMVWTNNLSRQGFPNTIFTKEKPGEYTVKIFHKGIQVREAKFTVDAKGGIAGNAYSGGIYPSLTIIPVKVSGTLDKWNPATWKTDAFYANPLSGFAVP